MTHWGGKLFLWPRHFGANSWNVQDMGHGGPDMRNAVSRFCLFLPSLNKTVFCLCLHDFRYYINLCQGIHGGLTDCPEGAAVCRHSSGRTQILGFVYTQKMSYAGGQNQIHYLILNICLKLCQPKKMTQLKTGSFTGTSSQTCFPLQMKRSQSAIQQEMTSVETAWRLRLWSSWAVVLRLVTRHSSGNMQPKHFFYLSFTLYNKHITDIQLMTNGYVCL